MLNLETDTKNRLNKHIHPPHKIISFLRLSSQNRVSVYFAAVRPCFLTRLSHLSKMLIISCCLNIYQIILAVHKPHYFKLFRAMPGKKRNRNLHMPLHFSLNENSSVSQFSVNIWPIFPGSCRYACKSPDISCGKSNNLELLRVVSEQECDRHAHNAAASCV